MISRQQWDALSDKEKMDYLFRQDQQKLQVIQALAATVDRLQEKIQQQHDTKLPKSEGHDSP